MTMIRYAATCIAILLLPAWVAAQGLTPEAALARMKPAEGLVVQLVAAEPLIRQPVTMTFDTRGRLWVIQYLQYPTPAGLKPVEVDNYLRTKYDRIPEPPPRGPRGLDRVTILYDADANGRYRKAKDFVSGLNLASGLALGNGGVYVLQAPYLLFYPDRNDDDVPDSEPEVLLTGFGMEDAHAVGNSLVWGPDGWLYGAQGSTVTAHITDPLTKKQLEFQQGVWRYHPRTKQFEIFAEGGGNTWGLDFDATGQIIAGTNWGGVAALHMVQGGYYVKGFAKHGPLHNPHTYGYFEHIPCPNFKGGHVTCGGIVYQGKALPAAYQNAYLACNLLDNNLYWYSMKRQGSSFTMKHEGTLLQGNDTWFRPIDLLTGPDGAVYVADWYDKRANHVDPVDNWDKTNGRIYKLVPSGGVQAPKPFDLKKLTTAELIAMLKHENSWQRGEARRLLGERQDDATQKALREAVEQNRAELSVDLLGALYCSGGLDAKLIKELFKHSKEEIRYWDVRLITDHATKEDTIKNLGYLLSELASLAENETSPLVRSQLASAAHRFITADTDNMAFIILYCLLKHEDINDPHIPLLIWWALEAGITLDQVRSKSGYLDLGREASVENPQLRKFLYERMGRRLMTEATDTAYQSLVRLLEKSVAWQQGTLFPTLLQGMEAALAGRRLTKMPTVLQPTLSSLAKLRSQDQKLTALLIRMGDVDAYRTGEQLLENSKIAEELKTPILSAMTSGSPSPSSDKLLTLLQTAKSDAWRLSILDALAAQSDVPSSALLVYYGQASATVRRRIISMLTARQTSAVVLGQAVADGRIAPKDIPLDQVQRLVRYHDATLDKLVARHWGSVTAQTTGEKQARIRSVVHMLNQRAGDAVKGKLLFTQHCATCHQLFGEGGKVGPELTGADRQNRDFLATHIVDPNFVIRPEYAAYTLALNDGRTLTGLLSEQSAGSITLLDAQANKIILARDKIDEMQPAKVSLMPEKLLDPLDDQQIRDLFAYLQKPASTTPQELPFPATVMQAPAKFDFADKMVAGIDRFLDKEIAASVKLRNRLLAANTVISIEKSLAENRDRLRILLGVVEERPAKPQLEYISSPQQPAKVGHGAHFDIYAVRWRAFGQVDAEGLLLVPTGSIHADVVALPDADQSPEQLTGLKGNLPIEMQTARLLAERGCRVLVPTLIDRKDTYSGTPGIRMTNQPHREWIYRQSFEMGRHLIGYEVMKVMAGTDWLRSTQPEPRPLGLVGYGEGGLIAFHAGALDDRIAVTCIDGYFSQREKVWQEPIYRNVWKQLIEFGDADIAAIYLPRKLVINQLSPPQVNGPPVPRSGRSGAAPGKLSTLSIEPEWKRLQLTVQLFPHSYHLNQLSAPDRIELKTFHQQLTNKAWVTIEPQRVVWLTESIDSEARMKRQVEQLVEHTQQLMRQSQAVRDKAFWNKLDRSNLPKYEASIEPFRQQLATEVIGKINHPASPPQPRARKLYEQPAYIAYEVELDVFAPDVIAYGLLLIPRDIKPGEKRPVVVCQHGLDGRPTDLADPAINNQYYHQYGCKLAERGFIVFAPQNPYIFGDRFRMLQRKANPLGLSLFSFIVAQHQQITDWLASLAFVDPERIGFYGLSYGGKTAMRVPALVKRYCLSICSADFNEWIWKNVAIDNRYSYMLTGEWEMVEWNLGHTFNYAEMAALIAPRPFMVERGHRDGVAPDEQVAYEYAKVRRHYADLKIPNRTAIEFFDGPHSIHGAGTFEFLHKHLKWPEESQ